jgi:hypothetical protein
MVIEKGKETLLNSCWCLLIIADIANSNECQIKRKRSAVLASSIAMIIRFIQTRQQCHLLQHAWYLVSSQMHC